MGKKSVEVALPLKAINKAFVLVMQSFRREPDFGVTCVNYDFAALIARAEEPR